jgi:hypothetical protein
VVVEGLIIGGLLKDHSVILETTPDLHPGMLTLSALYSPWIFWMIWLPLFISPTDASSLSCTIARGGRY